LPATTLLAAVGQRIGAVRDESGGFSPINSRSLPIIVGLVAMAAFTFVAAETPSNVVHHGARCVVITHRA